MNHHAFVYVGSGDEATLSVKIFLKKELSATSDELIDATTLTYEQLTVKDARDISALIGYGSRAQARQVYILTASRILPEAQNALLKVLEEPPTDVVIVLVVPVLSQLLKTVLSRVSVIDDSFDKADDFHAYTKEFLDANNATKQKLLDLLVKDARSDNEEKKERARTEARELLSDLQILAHRKYQEKKDTEMLEFLKDVQVALPLLYDKGASYKTIFEHLKLVLPRF